MATIRDPSASEETSKARLLEATLRQLMATIQTINGRIVDMETVQAQDRSILQQIRDQTPPNHHLPIDRDHTDLAGPGSAFRDRFRASSVPAPTIRAYPPPPAPQLQSPTGRAPFTTAPAPFPPFRPRTTPATVPIGHEAPQFIGANRWGAERNRPDLLEIHQDRLRCIVAELRSRAEQHRLSESRAPICSKTKPSSRSGEIELGTTDRNASPELGSVELEASENGRARLVPSPTWTTPKHRNEPRIGTDGAWRVSSSEELLKNRRKELRSEQSEAFDLVRTGRAPSPEPMARLRHDELRAVRPEAYEIAGAGRASSPPPQASLRWIELEDEQAERAEASARPERKPPFGSSNHNQVLHNDAPVREVQEDLKVQAATMHFADKAEIEEENPKQPTQTCQDGEEFFVRDQNLWHVSYLFVVGPYNNGYERFLEGLSKLFEEEIEQDIHEEVMPDRTELRHQLWVQDVRNLGALNTCQELSAPKFWSNIEVCSQSTVLYFLTILVFILGLLAWPTGIDTQYPVMKHYGGRMVIERHLELARNGELTNMVLEWSWQMDTEYKSVLCKNKVSDGAVVDGQIREKARKGGSSLLSLGPIDGNDIVGTESSAGGRKISGVRTQECQNRGVHIGTLDIPLGRLLNGPTRIGTLLYNYGVLWSWKLSSVLDLLVLRTVDEYDSIPLNFIELGNNVLGKVESMVTLVQVSDGKVGNEELQAAATVFEAIKKHVDILLLVQHQTHDLKAEIMLLKVRCGKIMVVTRDVQDEDKLSSGVMLLRDEDARKVAKVSDELPKRGTHDGHKFHGAAKLGRAHNNLEEMPILKIMANIKSANQWLGVGKWPTGVGTS